MEEISKLELEFFRLRYGYGNGEACVDWANERLQNDQEGDDLDIVLLTGARGRDEVLPLVESIIDRYCGDVRSNDEFVAGKLVSTLRNDYREGRVSIAELDATHTILYPRLGYPNWLAMLTRNCEYAADIPAFLAPFELELEYVASLWASAESKAEFDTAYNFATSQQHDASYG